MKCDSENIRSLMNDDSERQILKQKYKFMLTSSETREPTGNKDERRRDGEKSTIFTRQKPADDKNKNNRHRKDEINSKRRIE